MQTRCRELSRPLLRAWALLGRWGSFATALVFALMTTGLILETFGIHHGPAIVPAVFAVVCFTIALLVSDHLLRSLTNGREGDDAKRLTNRWRLMWVLWGSGTGVLVVKAGASGPHPGVLASLGSVLAAVSLTWAKELPGLLEAALERGRLTAKKIDSLFDRHPWSSAVVMTAGMFIQLGLMDALLASSPGSNVSSYNESMIPAVFAVSFGSIIINWTWRQHKVGPFAAPGSVIPQAVARKAMRRAMVPVVVGGICAVALHSGLI